MIPSSHYYSMNDYCRETFGHKLYRLSLDGGMTCPNRDGRLDTRGCIFCSQGGSGDFAARADTSIRDQLSEAITRIQSKMPKDGSGGYIAYFQAFTNTYAPVERLRLLYEEALSHPRVEVLSLATRPDCLPWDVLNLLEELGQNHPIWVELGLQTIHPASATYIRRGYDLPCFEEAVRALRKRGIHVIVHVILGLPGESREDMLATIDYLARQDIQGIKLQLLHVLKKTDLAADYAAGQVPVMEMEPYLDLVCECIRRLPPHVVIHRLTGDGPKQLLIAPTWTADKKKVWNTLQKKMKAEHVIQGEHFQQ